ncbi:hypothetical protein CLV35_1396 [Motilibacter peucedani]|uniref:Insertion element protein n=1 Tax=Motilibacter peucedani TaxID=598650 RepID=A0A420XS60_9ACTN|nr:hypothetical protein CLV35_1396 [Motilibacter peucedani]
MSVAPDERAVVFHCPYCAEEDLRPSEASPRAWTCGACRRVFEVQLLAISADSAGKEAR